MARGRIPERSPIGDTFQGALLQVDGAFLLAHEALPDAALVRAGDFVIRYGVRFMGKPFSIVPGIVALDYGDMLTGEDAWHFIYHKSHMHPRADVVGYRNDGQDDMLNVKYLDLALTPEVLVYGDAAATKPLASAAALIAPPALEIAPRLLTYLPRYDSLEAWHEAQKDTP